MLRPLRTRVVAFAIAGVACLAATSTWVQSRDDGLGSAIGSLVGSETSDLAPTFDPSRDSSDLLRDDGKDYSLTAELRARFSETIGRIVVVVGHGVRWIFGERGLGGFVRSTLDALGRASRHAFGATVLEATVVVAAVVANVSCLVALILRRSARPR
jgi:hypothetical protein